MAKNFEVILSINKLKNEKQANVEENKTQKASCSYEDILELIGFGRVQWLVVLFSGLNLLMSTTDLFGTGIIAIACQCDFKLTSVDKGVLTGIGLIGNISSSYFWGYYADTIGRRPMLITSILATITLVLISIFIPHFGIFLFLRFCIGVSVSGAMNVNYAYLGEFVSYANRPTAITYASLFIAIAIVYVPAISWLILLMDWSVEISREFFFRPWRLLPIFYVLPGFLALLLLLYLPESPKILFSLGEDEQAYKSLAWICTKNLAGRTLDEIVETKFKLPLVIDGIEKRAITKSTNNILNMFRKMWVETIPLFKRPLAKNFIICIFIMTNVYISAISLGIWFPLIQNRVGSFEGQELRVCDALVKRGFNQFSNSTITKCNDVIVEKTYIDYITYGSMCIVGYITMGTLLKFISRKVIFISSLGVAGLCGILLIWILDPFGIFVNFSLLLVLSELGFTLVNGMVVDLMPTHLCGQAVSICLMLGRLVGALATFVFGPVLESYCVFTFLMLSAFSILCALLTLFLPI